MTETEVIRRLKPYGSVIRNPRGYEVDIWHEGSADDIASLIARLPNVYSVMLSGGYQLSSRAYEYLASLRDLAELVFHGHDPNDAFYSMLTGHKSLTELGCSASVSNSGVRSIAQISYLAQLSLSATKTTDEGLREIGSLTNLLSLKLNQTSVQSDISILTSLPKLRKLSLAWTLIDDQALKGTALQMSPGLQYRVL